MAGGVAVALQMANRKGNWLCRLLSAILVHLLLNRIFDD